MNFPITLILPNGKEIPIRHQRQLSAFVVALASEGLLSGSMIRYKKVVNSNDFRLT